uniref:Uncharacterized protein n=1 Tax=Arundo donax TaxID=35708 RepID=A0A0A8YYS3_ARUDO
MTMILVGVAALCWAIWLCRNDSTFDKQIQLLCRLSSGELIGYDRALLQQKEEKESTTWPAKLWRGYYWILQQEWMVV